MNKIIKKSNIIIHKGVTYSPTFYSKNFVSGPIYSGGVNVTEVSNCILNALKKSVWEISNDEINSIRSQPDSFPILKLTKEKSWKSLYNNSLNYLIAFFEQEIRISYWTTNEKGYLTVDKGNDWFFSNDTSLHDLVDFILNHAKTIPDADFYLTKDGKRTIQLPPEKPRKKKIQYQEITPLSNSEYERLCKPAMEYLWNSETPDTNLPEFNEKLNGHFLYEEEGGFLDEELMKSIIEISRDIGENGLLFSDLSMENNGLEKESNSTYIPFENVEGFLESEIMLREKVIYSQKGDWGIISSGEGLAVLACEPKYDRKLRKIFPDINKDINEFIKRTAEKYITGNDDEVISRLEILMNIYKQSDILKLLTPFKPLKAEYKRILEERQ